MIASYEAGWCGFWLARWLMAHDIEVHVIQPSSVPVDRRMQRLQIELIVGLHRNAACRRPLNCFRDCVGVSEVVLVALPERLGLGRRDLPYVMTERN